MALPHRPTDSESSVSTDVASAQSTGPLSAYERVLQLLAGALRGTESAGRAAAGAMPLEFASSLAALRASPERQQRALAFLAARKTAAEGLERGNRLYQDALAASGPIARLKASAKLDLGDLKHRSAMLFAAASALRQDPAIGKLIPSAFGPLSPSDARTGQATVAAPPTTEAWAVPAAPATPARTWTEAAGGAIAAAREARAVPLPGRAAPSPPDTLAETAATIVPMYDHTVARMPFLMAGICAMVADAPPRVVPPVTPTVARALGSIFTAIPAACEGSRQALQQVADLRRGLIASKDPACSLAPARLRGLALPLTTFPRRFAPFPILQDLFPLMDPGLVKHLAEMNKLAALNPAGFEDSSNE